jgi:hypothetical protein
MTVEFLKMIGHGTTGSDGIEPGIHLRWGFNDKLGFPTCFELYRRKSKPKNLHYLSIDNGMTLKLPYQQDDNGFQFTLESVIIGDREVPSIRTKEITLPNGRHVPVIALDGELRFSFSEPVSRIELELVISAQADYEIIAVTVTKEYRPLSIGDAATGLQTIAFDAPGTTGLILRGTGIAISQLRAWVCTAGGDWVRIKENCGCGLPIHLKRTSYTSHAYPPFMDNDLVSILCRLGVQTMAETDFTLEAFLDLQALLLSLQPEGSLVPWGWTLFPSTPSNETPQTSNHEFEYSKYDFLLTQSLHVFYARILDLYFVDTQVDPDTYYDYKVRATWPESNLRRLEHELTFDDLEIEQKLYYVSNLNENVVLVARASPQVVVQSAPAARVEQGLLLTAETGFTIVNFIKPVTEVQLGLVNRDFNSGQNEITVEAYRNYVSSPVDVQKLTMEQGLVRVRAKRIDTLRIYGSNVVLSRIHYDEDPYPMGPQEYIVCGLKKQQHYPLEKPAGLTATLIPGGAVNTSEGNVIEKPYVVGLRWNASEEPNMELPSIAPVMYHAQRKTKDGSMEQLTEKSPILVAPSLVEEAMRNVPIGWPAERQYYLDALTEKGKYAYRIASLDLFGRNSPYTDYVTYQIHAPSPPPPPAKVTAQFLDYNTYSAASNSFSDPTLNNDDKAWLQTNKKNAIVVRWQWTENLQLQAPDVDGFNIFFKNGWLNSYSGEITNEYEEDSITLVLTREEAARYAVFGTSPVTVNAYKFKSSLHFEESVPADAFRLCWLSQGPNRFLVLKNTAGKKPTLWVMAQDMVTYKPEMDRGFGVAVTKENSFFINYLDAQNWTDQSISHYESKHRAMKMYRVYLEAPAFPEPPIGANDKEKVRYGQIAVNSQIGTLQGSMSSAATIMSIYRTCPPAPRAFLPEESVAALKATPANVHGKSSFTLRWSKTHISLKHHIYRTLDATLFLVDNQNRRNRADFIYDNFKADYPEFNPADVDAVQQISWQADPKQVSQNYAGLIPQQLQILASLPDNTAAFTQLTGLAISETDAAFEDRVTEIPNPLNGSAYAPDPDNILLYVDDTLDGRGSNRYFYALKTLDTNGLTSPLSPATLPVECPKTTPPPAPVLTTISGGVNQINIKWAKNPGAVISGYLVYRTQDKKLARDWRRMELIKASVDHDFSVAVDGELPHKEFEFVDSSVLPRQPYFYVVVAVGLSDDDKWLKSRSSSPKSGQAYDFTPPEPPIWISANWDGSRSIIHLEWSTTENLDCEVKRYSKESATYFVVSDRLAATSYNSDTGVWLFEWDDENVSPGGTQKYIIKAINDIRFSSESVVMEAAI